MNICKIRHIFTGQDVSWHFFPSIADNCVKCPAGTYSLEKSEQCISWDAGTYSLEGSSSCLKCKDGFYSSKGGASCK